MSVCRVWDHDVVHYHEYSILGLGLESPRGAVGECGHAQQFACDSVEDEDGGALIDQCLRFYVDRAGHKAIHDDYLPGGILGRHCLSRRDADALWNKCDLSY
jgi:hypothetical protein